jgi:hypothetical protein
MELKRNQLDEAVARGLISTAQADGLWAFLSAQAQERPALRLTHVLYYLGGLIAIGAMTLFMSVGWERFGGWGLFFIALAYAGGGLWLTRYWLGCGLKIPAGIAAAFVVSLTPLAIYGLQVALGGWAEGRVYRDYHQLIDWRWLMMELATLATGAIMLWRYRLPFMVMPVAVTLWYLGMDLTPLLFDSSDQALNWEQRKFVSLVFGAAMLLLAFWVDLRTRHDQDYAFWLYLIGMLTFWGGLSLLKSDSELGKFGYFCINLGLIALAALLGRRVFAVFGGLGAAGYLGYLAWHVFRDSLLFPFALSAIGLGVIWLGLVWQRHEQAIGARLRERLPLALRELLEARQ